MPFLKDTKTMKDEKKILTSADISCIQYVDTEK